MQKNYFKSIAFAAIACLIATPAQAQSPGTHSLELSGGIREYMGDLGSSVGFARRPDYQGGQVNFGYYVSPALDLVTNFSFGEIGYSRKWEGFNLRKEYQWQSFRANTMDLTVGARYKLNNGSILPEDAKIAPYFQAGIGGFYAFTQTTWGPDAYVQDEFYADVTKKRAVTDMNGAVQGAFGVNVYLTERIGLRYSFTATYTMSDIWDGANGGTPDPVNNIAIHKLWRTNDMYALHAIGFTYAIGEGMGTSVKKPKDKDEDGVPDKYDLCKNTEPKYRRFVDSVGCPADTDKDGILDADDKCPDVAGPAQFKGCPDADGDGIQDKLDACPNQAGDAKFNGCPDTDGDGVPNIADLDDDNDGVLDFAECACPSAGTTTPVIAPVTITTIPNNVFGISNWGSNANLARDGSGLSATPTTEASLSIITHSSPTLVTNAAYTSDNTSVTNDWVFTLAAPSDIKGIAMWVPGSNAYGGGDAPMKKFEIYVSYLG